MCWARGKYTVMGLIDINKSNLPLVVSLIIILSSVPIAHALFLTPVEIIDSTGDGTNTLSSVEGVATDSSGNVFVTGAISNNVFKITPGGTITEIIDSTGDGTSPLNSAHAVATDSSGNVFVVGKNSGNIFKISTPGTCKTSGGTPCTITELIDNINPHGIATDTSGNIVFISGKFGNTVQKMTPGGILTEIIDGTGDGTNSLGFPHGIATDSSDNVFVTGVDTDNAFKISTPGTCKTSGGTPCIITEIIDSAGDGTNTLDDPRNIATDSSGNVFVVGKNTDNAFKISTPGTCKTSGGTPFATDSSGNVFVIGDISNNAFKISTPGTCKTSGGTPCIITEIIDSTGDGGGNPLSEPFDVATDSSGTVFVTGRVSNNAFKIAKDTPIGGTILPIDKTALLLASVQSISMWMIPVVAAGVVIGVFVIKRRK